MPIRHTRCMHTYNLTFVYSTKLWHFDWVNDINMASGTMCEFKLKIRWHMQYKVIAIYQLINSLNDGFWWFSSYRKIPFCIEVWNSPSGVFHCDGFVSNFGHCTVLWNLFIVYSKMASKYALNQQVMVIFLFII